jgi:uroporphyrin-3 C-methyltransferase
VTVRRSAEGEASRLTLEDKDFLRQGLWMQIESARLALMRHDQGSWDDSLSRARSVLERWFDDSSAEYRSVYGELAELLQLNIAPEMPDISGPWMQLQQLRQARPAPALPEGQE